MYKTAMVFYLDVTVVNVFNTSVEITATVYYITELVAKVFDIEVKVAKGCSTSLH